ncbi:MAG: formate dehydrogenase [Actinophytocola sp.]|nr:formate dehydrogenase [Actinophytocola sp.]
MTTMSPVMRMAHDISAQFRHLSLGEAADVIADHMRKFWDPRMRAQLVADVEQAGIHCDSHVAAAARLLRSGGG